MAKPKSNGMKIFLGIALAIILFGIVNLGVATFYEGPQYEDYCISYNTPVTPEKIDSGYYETCSDEYRAAQDEYDNTIFYVFVSLGLILAVVGLIILNLSFQIVGIGSGVALILEGILRNLNNKIPAFIAGVIVFLILSYFVWRTVKE